MLAIHQDYWFNSSLDSLLRKTDQKGEIIPRIRTFLKRGGDINQSNSFNLSLLTVAQAKRLDEVVKFLISNKALEQEKQADFFNLGKKIIVFSKNPKFITKIQCALYILSSKETGRLLIDKIEKGRHTVFINDSSTENSCHYDNREDAEKREIGCSSTIYVTGNSWPGYSFFTVLGHELIHAMHASYGTVLPSSLNKSDKCIWSDDEEYNTIVGFPSKTHEITPTDNRIRREHNVKERSTHNGTVERVSSQIGSIFRPPLSIQKTYSGATSIRISRR